MPLPYRVAVARKRSSASKRGTVLADRSAQSALRMECDSALQLRPALKSCNWSVFQRSPSRADRDSDADPGHGNCLSGRSGLPTEGFDEASCNRTALDPRMRPSRNSAAVRHIPACWCADCPLAHWFAPHPGFHALRCRASSAGGARRCPADDAPVQIQIYRQPVPQPLIARCICVLLASPRLLAAAPVPWSPRHLGSWMRACYMCGRSPAAQAPVPVKWPRCDSVPRHARCRIP